MTGLRSGNVLGELRALFSDGTLTGVGEGQLLERFLTDRDEAAFAELIARHGPMVFGNCRRWLDDPHDVEDAFQATFLILLRKAANLRDRDSLSNWLFGVSLRVARRARTNAVRRRTRERPAGLDVAEAGPTTDDPADRETMTIVDQEIRRLPEKQQAAVVLCLVQGQTHDAAARELGWPIGTVKSRLASARATLTRRLTRRGVTPSVVALSHAAERFSAVSLPQEMVRRTIDAVVSTGANGGAQGPAISATVQAMLHGVAISTAVTRLRWVAAATIVLGAMAWSAPAFLAARDDLPPPGKVPVARPQPLTQATAKPKLDLHGDPLPQGALVRMGTIKHRQEAPIYHIAYSPDGKYVVTDGDDQQVRIWDAADGRLIRRVDAGEGWVRDFGFSDDGALLTASVARRAKGLDDLLEMTRLELATGHRISQMACTLHNGTVAIKFSTDGRKLAVRCFDGALRVLNTANGAESCHFKLPHSGAVGPMAFSAAGDRLAAASCNPQTKFEISIFDPGLKKHLRNIPAGGKVVGDLGFSPDGTILTGRAGMQITQWNIASGQATQLLGHGLYAMAFSADRKSAAAIDNGGDLAIWDVASLRRLESFQTGISNCKALAFSPDGRTVALNGGATALHYWDRDKRLDRLAQTDTHSNIVDAILVTPDGKTLITSSHEKSVRLWDLASGRQRRALEHRGEVHAITLSADGRTLTTGAEIPSLVYLWDLKTENAPFTCVGGYTLLTPSYPLAFFLRIPDDAMMNVGSDGRLRCWEVSRNRPIQVTEPAWSAASFPIETTDFMDQAQFFNGGRRLAIRGILGGLHVADLDTGKERFVVSDTNLFALATDERTLAVWKPGEHVANKLLWDGSLIKNDLDGSIFLLDSATGKQKLQIAVPGPGVWAMAFSPDGRTLAATTGWEQGRIHLYDTATGRETRTISTPPLRKSAITFTPDGSRIITGMADTSVLVWDLRFNP